jgi:hypothetical protein
MHKPKSKRLRWDRIGAVAGVLILGTWGLAAVIPSSTEAEEVESEGRVSVMSSDTEENGVQEESSPASEFRSAEEAREATQIDSPPPSQAEVKPIPSGPLPRKGIAPCSCSKHTMRMARNPYTQHQQRARTLPGSFFVKNKTALTAGAERGDLERIPEVGRGYHLSGLTHSEPFLLPAARAVLEDMANRFADAMEGTKDEGASIRITSLTRTEAQQKRLRRRNSNAFRGKSSHSYGASFDVAFIDRPNESVTCGGPTWAMQTILQDMQKEGKILVIPEGICMHITPR